ncbi:hypothetical protein Tco_0774550 [Tanacetum coccineum]|uniref:Uncharacterized protein n=1 Tax=Tanacetum coccineum TaxID=301880 RepID=A0ABQ4ZNX6_9ASTR
MAVTVVSNVAVRNNFKGVYWLINRRPRTIWALYEDIRQQGYTPSSKRRILHYRSLMRQAAFVGTAVVKVRTTPDAITEGSWGFEHTKKVFLEEVIPFINSLRASFKDCDNGLHSELNEVKMMFNQMEAAVEQCSVDKKV